MRVIKFVDKSDDSALSFEFPYRKYKEIVIDHEVTQLDVLYMHQVMYEAGDIEGMKDIFLMLTQMNNGHKYECIIEEVNSND